jgi:hypothetical protein
VPGPDRRSAPRAIHAPPSEADTEKDPRSVAMEVVAMEVVAMESKPDERPEEEPAMEVTMPPAVPVAMMPEAPSVDLLDQRTGLYLQRRASNRRRHRRSRHQPEPQHASNCSKQCCFPHNCLLRVPVRNAGARLGPHFSLTAGICAPSNLNRI